jgi:hypothetical protein
LWVACDGVHVLPPLRCNVNHRPAIVGKSKGHRRAHIGALRYYFYSYSRL